MCYQTIPALLYRVLAKICQKTCFRRTENPVAGTGATELVEGQETKAG